MRSDVFLHFLNRDTREIFGVYGFVATDQARIMRRALNAAIALCEDRCIAPPGFVLEDNVAFELAEAQVAYLNERILQLPLRENSLSDFAEKKRVGYQRMRDRYSGLFSDTRIDFLSHHALGLIRRKSQITEGILQGWQAGPDSKQRIWTPVKRILSPTEASAVSNIATVLNDSGTALTWAAIAPNLSPLASVASTELRDALQHTYFGQYCKEFELVVLGGIPFMTHDFGLPARRRSYGYHRLGIFLDQFNLKEVIFDAPANLLVALRNTAGFIRFMDAYVAVAEQQVSDTSLKFAAATSAKAVRFDWQGIRQRRARLFEVSPLEVIELADAMEEVAGTLNLSYDLPIRSSPTSSPTQAWSKPITARSHPPDLVLFVALEEELNELTKHLDLRKNSTTPEATGKIGDLAVDVVCPRNMGRVAAAVAMANYLATRTNPPKLILILGIAGGFRENGSHEGHIVCVTKVVDLALRKVVEEDGGGPSPNFRREDYRTDDALSRILQSHEFDSEQWVVDACASDALDWPKDRRPSFTYGPMASADEVVSSAQWSGLMLDSAGGERKLLGVEMEAGGVCAAAERAKPRIPYCMLRAISDQADPSKADNSWRRRGIRTIAHLLERLPLAEVIKLAS